LFYHLKLRSYVVIELKKGGFKAEYAGKMNFYCNVVDDRLRHPDDKPTIGLILCQDLKTVLAEYALRGIDKPIGISEYELTRALPTNLQSALPSIEELERELGEISSDDEVKMRPTGNGAEAVVRHEFVGEESVGGGYHGRVLVSVYKGYVSC
jgi:hypothetical protein